MIEMIQIKKACNDILRAEFPGIKIYGADSVEGLARPSFYTEIVPYVLNYESVNLAKQMCGFKISLLEKTPDEEYQLQSLAKIRAAFGLKLSVNDRKISISDVDFDYTGVNNDIFQITIRFEWYDSIHVAETRPLMETVSIEEKIR